MVQTREFTELLKGCRPVKDENGNIIVQSILNMEIVCLTTDKEYSLDDRFANPLEVLSASNHSYGQMDWQNGSNKDTIVPSQMAAMTKQSAQNHGMVKGAYIKAKTRENFNDAGCVQGSQCGHFRNVSGQELRMIPVVMREMLFDRINNTSGFDHIYPAIRELGRKTQSNTGEYLDKYFNKYDKKLEQFIAHFERPKNLIGIIVLVDGEIVAIDKFPSFTYSEQVWDMVIRDCYGALAVISELKEHKAKTTFTDTYSALRGRQNESVLEKLERALNKTKEERTKSVEEKLATLLELTLEAKQDTEGSSTSITGSQPKSYKLEHEGYIGQVITESDFNHLVSIVKRESFDPKALEAVTELRRKARSQDRFQL
jgi:hypothetical protein